ncbi:MAG: thioredoxin domain-containing protein [Phycisphaerales bacterium]|nr:thioredoxin domain-containing protein [Phycisphaerales bacterium]
MKRLAWLGILIGLVLSISGAYFCVQLTIQQTTGQAFGGVLADLCSAAEAKCDAVLGSRWAVFPPKPETEKPAELVGGTWKPEALEATSTTRFGIPVSFFGFLYFTFMTAWFLGVGRPNYPGRYWHLLPLSVVIVSCLGSAAFIFLMARVLNAWCPSCLLVHSINFLLLIIMLALWPRRPAATGNSPARAGLRAASMPVPHPTPRLVVVTFALALAIWVAYLASVIGYKQSAKANVVQNNLDDISKRAEVLSALYWSQQPQEVVGRMGDSAGSVTENQTAELVVFSDITCVACRHFEAFLTEQIKPLFDRSVRVVFRHHPLGAECNPHVPQRIAKTPCTAAYAVEAARLQGGEEMAGHMLDELFGRGGHLDHFDYPALATLLGMDPARFAEDMESQTVRDRVLEDVEAGHRLGVDHTPTIFLNGRRVSPLAVDKIEFWQKIAGELVSTSQPAAVPIASLD